MIRLSDKHIESQTNRTIKKKSAIYYNHSSIKGENANYKIPFFRMSLNKGNKWFLGYDWFFLKKKIMYYQTTSISSSVKFLLCIYIIYISVIGQELRLKK